MSTQASAPRTPREIALEHTVMALCDVLLTLPLPPDVHGTLSGLRGRMNADTPLPYLAAMARQLSATAQQCAERPHDPPDQFGADPDDDGD